jgi:hypothetical protein
MKLQILILNLLLTTTAFSLEYVTNVRDCSVTALGSKAVVFGVALQSTVSITTTSGKEDLSDGNANLVYNGPNSVSLGGKNYKGTSGRFTMHLNSTGTQYSYEIFNNNLLMFTFKTRLISRRTGLSSGVLYDKDNQKIAELSCSQVTREISYLNR